MWVSRSFPRVRVLGSFGRVTLILCTVCMYIYVDTVRRLFVDGSNEIRTLFYCSHYYFFFIFCFFIYLLRVATARIVYNNVVSVCVRVNSSRMIVVMTIVI